MYSFVYNYIFLSIDALFLSCTTNLRFLERIIQTMKGRVKSFINRAKEVYRRSERFNFIVKMVLPFYSCKMKGKL